MEDNLKNQTTENNQKQSHGNNKIPEANFKFFLSTLGMQAWIAMGVIANPMSDKTEENLEQAKFIIDTLSILQEKTKGNLTEDESKLLDTLLYELRLGYVDKTDKKDDRQKTA